MRPGQKKGLISVALGILFMVFVFLPAEGANVDYIRMGDIFLLSMMGGATGYTIFVGVMGLFSLLLAITMIVYGICLYANFRAFQLEKHFNLMRNTLCGFAVFTSILVMIDVMVLNGRGASVMGVPGGIVMGSGTIFSLVAGILAIVLPLIVVESKIGKKEVKKEQKGQEEKTEETPAE